jgi:hypothetical protein
MPQSPADLPPRPPPALVAPAPTPARGALVFSLGVAGGASEWRGDGLGYGGFAVGLRLWRVVTPFVGASLGYARVDQRLLTRLTVGVDVGYTFAERYRPRVFAAFVHQHEESLAAVAEEPFGAILGIGGGIRHRAGAYFGAGFDWRFFQRGGVQLAVGPELSAMYLTYSSGPSWYLFGGVALTGQVRLW